MKPHEVSTITIHIFSNFFLIELDMKDALIFPVSLHNFSCFNVSQLEIFVYKQTLLFECVAGWQ